MQPSFLVKVLIGQFSYTLSGDQVAKLLLMHHRQNWSVAA
jgi:hypothetical protein